MTGFAAGCRSSPYCKEEWQDSCTDTAEVGAPTWHFCHSQKQQPQAQLGKNHSPCVLNLPLIDLYRMHSGSHVWGSIQWQCMHDFDWASCSALWGKHSAQKSPYCAASLAPYEHMHNLSGAKSVSVLFWLFHIFFSYVELLIGKSRRMGLDIAKRGL